MRGGHARKPAAPALVLVALALASFDTPLIFDSLDFDRHARSIVATGTYALTGDVEPPPGLEVAFAPDYRPPVERRHAARRWAPPARERRLASSAA